MLNQMEIEKLDKVLEGLRLLRDHYFPKKEIPDQSMVLKMIGLVREVLGEKVLSQ